MEIVFIFYKLFEMTLFVHHISYAIFTSVGDYIIQCLWPGIHQ